MRKFLLSIVVLCAITFTGCMKPYHEDLLVDINTSEVAVLVETVNDNGQASIAPKGKEGESNSDFFKSRLVNARKVNIPYYWKQTSRQYFNATSMNGKWVPAARLIVVDTKPETREWSKSKDNPIWVESKDSVGFSTGISITARIEDREDAIKFLSNYPPEERREVTTQGGDPFEVEIAALEQIMDEEVRTKIQEVFSYEAAAYPMDDLRGQKQEIMNKIKEDVIPYFQDRGINITTIGQFGGFEYENPKIQEAIDEVFAAQQDKQVALAEADAAEQRKLALRLKGEGEAAQILEAKKGEAEGIKAVADAKAYELEKLNENPEAYIALKTLEVQMQQIQTWDGKLPVTLFGGQGDGKSPTLLMNIDKLTK